jgi:hypothetical protein
VLAFYAGRWAVSLDPIDTTKWAAVSPPFTDEIWTRADTVLSYYDCPIIWTTEIAGRLWCAWWVDCSDDRQTDRHLVFEFTPERLEGMQSGALTCCEFIRGSAVVYLAESRWPTHVVYQGRAEDLTDDYLPSPDATLLRGEG